MKYYKIVLEGIDKTGKDLIKEYIRTLSNGKYTTCARGVFSLMVYNELYNRNYVYDLEGEKNTLFVHLIVEKKDWEIRCKLSKENPINFEINDKKFKEYFENKTLQFEYGFRVLTYNTSLKTPYQIAIEIINYMEWLNYNDNKN